MNRIFGIAGLTMSLGLLGCSSTPAVFYTLDTGTVPQPGGSNAPSVVVTQVGIADMLNRPQLVTRSGNQIRFSEQHRWAEPLKYAVPRVLADEIGRALDSSQVLAAPVSLGRFEPDFRVQVDIQRLDYVEGDAVEADMVWRIESRQGWAVVKRSQMREPVANADPAAQVAAQRRALSRLAGEIAAQIKSAPATGK